MKPKNTWLWVLLAAGLFAFIFFYQRHVNKSQPGPIRILPAVQAAAVTAIQVAPIDKLEIRAERANGVWRLTKPLSYPAEANRIETLLSILERLTPDLYITPRELKERPKADEEYGLNAAQLSLILSQAEYRVHLRIGALTSTGDQLYLRVDGDAGVYVVGAGLLNYIPRSANEWRDTSLLNLKGLVFDRVTVTNGAKLLEIRRDSSNGLWRILRPSPARADQTHLQEALQKLQDLRINRFLPDEPKPDLEALGLQPPDLEIALAQGTEIVARLQFGKNPTNDPQQIYGRRPERSALVIVSNQWLAPWRVSGSANDFRDPNLVAPTQPVEAIDVLDHDSFSICLQTNETWLIQPENFPADRALMSDFLSALTNLQIVSFVKDLVADPDLPAYGLAPPARQYTLRAAASSSPAGLTNPVIAELSFGTNQQDKVFARRRDESSVYAVKLADYEHLPTASWQLRDRQIWNFSETNAARVSIRQRGKTRQMIRKGTYEWALAPGSQGSLEPIRIEETVRGLCHLAASAWTARGATNLGRFGFTDDGHQVIIELNDGQQLSVEFGREAPSSCQYAAINRDGDLFIFECPWLLYRDVRLYLSVPASQ